MTVTTNREKINLAGSWELIFDPSGEGVHAGWVGELYPRQAAETVTVPEIWNIHHPGTDGTAFYQKHFTLPSGWQDRVVELVFEGASYLTSVWVNGEYVGSHEGAYTPFRFDITSCLIPLEENQLVVRVSSLSKTRAVDGILLHEAPAAKQSWYYTFGGIWGDIYLEALPRLACHSVRVTPDLPKQQARIDLWLQNTLPEARQADVNLTVNLISKRKIAEQPSRVNIPPGTSRFTFHLPIPSPQKWTCQDPALYQLKVEVIDLLLDTVDIHETRFGMRDFTMREGQYFLNGEPIYIRGVLLQPDYPISLVIPQNKATLEQEIRLVKDAGFNLLRIHLRPAASGLLDLADELGVLVYAETSLGWIRESPRLLEHGLRETEALINRDYNHPSIVFWGIYNENPPAASLNGVELAKFARGIDPTRLIVHNSGGSLAIDQDFGWIDRTWVMPTHETMPQRAMDIHLYLGCYPTRSIYHWLQSVGSNTVPSSILSDEGLGSPAVFSEFDREMLTYRGKVFVSEIGCGAFNDLDKTVTGFGLTKDTLDARQVISLRDGLDQGFHQRSLEKVFGSVAHLFEQSLEMQSRGVQRQVEAVLTNPQISGFIVTQLNDNAWELEAGILDIWRDPKPAYFALKRLNQPFCLITSLQTHSLYPDSSTCMDISLLNQVPLAGSEQIEVTIQDQSGKVISRQYLQPVYSAGFHRLDPFTFEAGEQCGSYQIFTRLIGAQTLLAETSETIHCLSPVRWENLQEKIFLWGSLPPLFQGENFAELINPPFSPPQDGQVILVGSPSGVSTDEWVEILRLVNSGNSALIGALSPENTIACQALSQTGMPIELHPGYGSWMGCHHWLPLSGLTEDLPTSGGLASEAFADILPRYVLAELGGAVLAGSIRCVQDRDAPKEIRWRSDIEQVSFGRGRLLFCQYRTFEQGFSHPLASTLAYNLIKLASDKRDNHLD
jgi:beta-galactosidase